MQVAHRASAHGYARRGYVPISSQKQFHDTIEKLIKSAITRESGGDHQKAFLKRKRNDDMNILKIVNSYLRSSIIITFIESALNQSRTVNVFFKRYRHNTIDQFGLPCRTVRVQTYDLDKVYDCVDFVHDIEAHMRYEDSNLKTVNSALPLRVNDFEDIKDDSLYALEIYNFNVSPDPRDPMESDIELALTSDKMQKDLTIKVKDIINFNSIEDLVGKWVVLNHLGAFKIKTKQELGQYNVIH